MKPSCYFQVVKDTMRDSTPIKGRARKAFYHSQRHARKRQHGFIRLMVNAKAIARLFEKSLYRSCHMQSM
jgi:hypothetical protein